MERVGAEAILGFDVGTTAVKAVLIGVDDDALLGVASVPYPTRRPRPGWVEQDARSWTAAMGTAWERLRHEVGPVQLRSVGIVSQVNSYVLVDETCQPLTEVITWQDVRSAEVAGELDRSIDDATRVALWGGPFKVDASFPLSRLEWFRRHRPEAVARARWLLTPKDYCVASLSGAFVTDPMSPIGLVGSDERYIPGVLEMVAGADRVLPPIQPFDAPAGEIVAHNAVNLPAGVPIAVGTMDAWGNVYGSGLVRPGLAMEVAGTSEIIGVLSDRAVPTPGVISFPPVRGRRLHAGPTQASGDSLAWAARCFGTTIEELLALAAQGLADPQQLVFLPHLSGERAPLWNPAARGVFLGISSSTELRHLALAVLEGVAFSCRQLLGACEAAAGGPASEVRLSGGGARSDLWNRIKASAHGRSLGLLAVRDSGGVGAALMGAVAAGIEPSIDVASSRRVAVASQIEPEPGLVERLDDLYGVYRRAYDALRDVFPALTGEDGGSQ